MLEKRCKVIEELLQTEKDYIKDLQMCVEEIIDPLQRKQVHRCVSSSCLSRNICAFVSVQLVQVILQTVRIYTSMCGQH